jgi:hypothetical protein
MFSILYKIFEYQMNCYYHMERIGERIIAKTFYQQTPNNTKEEADHIHLTESKGVPLHAMVGLGGRGV